MSDHPQFSRRSFLKAAGASAAVSLSSNTTISGSAPERGRLPQRVLGKTGLPQPILGMGTAPAGLDDFNAGVALFHEAIDLGVSYMDTAPEFAGYGKAQRQLGKVLQERRKDVFLVTKCYEPDGQKALALLKQNLKELETEYADLVYAHSIGADKMDLKQILGPDGVFHALQKAQSDGLTRFVGCSGHNRPWKFLEAMKHFDIAVMMNAVNIADRNTYDFESKVWPEAARRGIGLVAMKVFGGMKKSRQSSKGARMPRQYQDLAFRYALSLPGVRTAVVGMHDRDELHENVARARAFQPLNDEERAAIEEPGKRLAQEWKEHFGPVT